MKYLGLPSLLIAAACSHTVPYPNYQAQKLVEAAMQQTQHFVTYDGSYTTIPYPMGDVPEHIGVCSDVVIRAYRKGLGIDLQQLVHEDMVKAFSQYPTKWGLPAPDTNIDHRRVLNLEVFFTRKGASLPITYNPQDYLPGDVIAMDVGFPTTESAHAPKPYPHIGIVSNQLGESGNLTVINNLGKGVVLSDMLVNYKITGHFRYFGE